MCNRPPALCYSAFMGNRKTVTGQCKLCLLDHVELRNSHIVPAGLYKMLRNTSKDGNPNPCFVRDGVEVQTSYQETARLLCPDCEQRLSTHGERWVLGHGLKADGSFPLGSFLVESVGRVWPDTLEELYCAATIPRIKVSAIVYFATSVFWRSSVYPSGSPDLQVKLGPFEEAFRLFLMGETEFPTDAALIVTVRPMSFVSGLVEWPSKLKRFQDTHAHSFVMPGMGFKLFVSKNIPADIRRFCFVRGPGNPMIFSNVLEYDLAQRASKALNDATVSSKRSALQARTRPGSRLVT